MASADALAAALANDGTQPPEYATPVETARVTLAAFAEASRVFAACTDRADCEAKLDAMRAAAAPAFGALDALP